MTVLTKQYVTTEDILGIRLECSSCNTAIDLPMTRAGSSIPLTCPNCRVEWFDQHQSPNIGKALENFVSAYKNLKQLLHKETRAASGFELSIEVSNLSK